MSEIYHSPSKGKVNLKDVTQTVASFIAQEPEGKYKIIIGTDSQGNGKIDFVTAIILHRLGRGGIYFWRKVHQEKIYSLPQKIFQEVSFSLDTAQRLIDNLRQSLAKAKDLTQSNLEIHIDVGENGPSKQMIKQVVGMVQGNGFCAKYKPDSYGASVVADKHT